MTGKGKAQEAERLGFESIWCAEHIIAPVDVPYSAGKSSFFPDANVSGFGDPLVKLARASGVTTRIRLGTSVLLVPEHQPLLLAKQIATLDYYSGGRFILGVGTGWHREESEIMGVEFDRRWTQTRECLEILKAAWTHDAVAYEGRYYRFPAVRVYPQPASKPHPPILLGGIAPNVLRRVAAIGDGWAPEKATPDSLKEQLRELHALLAEQGRDPRTVQISVHGKPPDPELIGDFFAAGADRVVPGLGVITGDMGEALAALETVAKAVLPVAARF